MQKQDYAGLSRTFDVYYPDVKQLVKETEQFYNSNYTDSETWRLTDYSNVRLIGMFTLNKNDYDLTLPRLYFKKKAEMTNPVFYIITSPSLEDTQERIIHIGTSVEAAAPYACSVSALTGGVVPNVDKLRGYSTYLKIMSYVKRYGYCTVYELQTGYDNIHIKGINGTTFTKETFAKQIFNFVNCDKNGYKFNDDPFKISSQTERFHWQEQNTRNGKIWDAVSSFKVVANAGPELLHTLNRLRGIDEGKDSNNEQEITITQDGLNNITFTFKNKVELLTPDELKFDKFVGLEKVITPSARILCQTGDTVYDKYTSYIAHKVKNGANDQNVNPVPLKQTALNEFEKTFCDLANPNGKIAYKNIFLGGLKHTEELNRYHTISISADNTNSAIEMDFGKKLSFSEVRTLTYAVEKLFDLDPDKTKVTLSF